jgi:hypothetical protein
MFDVPPPNDVRGKAAHGRHMASPLQVAEAGRRIQNRLVRRHRRQRRCLRASAAPLRDRAGAREGPRQLPAPHDRATEAGRSVAGRAPVVRAQGCRRRCDAGRKRKKVPRVGEAPTVSGVAVNFMGNNDGSLGIDRSRFACSGVFANHPRFCHGSL